MSTNFYHYNVQKTVALSYTDT